jgi:large subunit ribosomal protein L4
MKKINDSINLSKKNKNFSLPPKVFNIKVNNQAIFDTILFERASRRKGNHKVKNRSEVRGGGRKPFAQKHTGKARAGSIRSPI